MNENEFNEWVRYHGDCVGGFTEWLAKCRDAVQQRRVLKLWLEALSDVSLADAKVASMAIMRGDLDAAAFGNHPKAIRRWAKDARGSRIKKRERKFVDGREVFRCALCLDDGWVTCYHPAAIKEALQNRVGCVETVQHKSRENTKRYDPRPVMKSLRTCGYACTCDEGTDKLEHGATVYDARRCIRVTALTHEQQIAELFAEADRIVSEGVKNHPNYTSAFEQFNSGEFVNQELGF